MCGKTGARYIRHPVPLPVTTHADMVESLWSAVTPQTRVIFMSHITSPTALIFPAEQICRRARKAGILTVVDGAHAPGQLPLRLDEIGADFYVGNCHKWQFHSVETRAYEARSARRHPSRLGVGGPSSRP